MICELISRKTPSSAEMRPHRLDANRERNYTRRLARPGDDSDCARRLWRTVRSLTTESESQR